MSRVFRTPIREEGGDRLCVEIKRKKLCKLLDEKWANSDCNTLEEPVCKFPVLLIYVFKCPLICFIQGLW
jgi:hypothetical protein